MQKNIGSLLTLIRNRLNNDASTLEEKLAYFHAKGIEIGAVDDLYFIKSNSNTGEFASIPAGIIFRGTEVVCYHGFPIQKKTYDETKSGIFVWNKNAVLFDIISGKKVYVYHDTKSGWACSDDKKSISPMNNTILNMIYNIESLDPRNTYELTLCEKGEDSGLFLIAAYDNKKFFELDWKVVDSIASRHKFKRPPLYQLSDNDILESSDLPIISQDQCMTKFEIYEI